MITRRLPAEWNSQSGVMLTWPHADSDWGSRLDEVEPVFAEIASQIAQREKVLIVVTGTSHRQHVEQQLVRHSCLLTQVRFAIAPSNDTWARDHGPITVLANDQPRLLDFTFNGWGNKHPAGLDNAINRELQRQDSFGEIPLESLEFVLEGGSIDTDGEGTLLTTRACLLNPNRNPGFEQAQIEQHLKQWLGIERIHWLSHGYLSGDDTDSHIDMLARFCPDNTIAYMQCDDPGDEHYPELQAMQGELEQLRTRDGHPYRLIPLPWPAPIFNAQGERLPASYANFLILNDALLVPQYRDEKDPQALSQLQRCFPDSEIIGIDCRPLIEQFGSLHCLTMQFPAGVL
ncbi:agmatine deiminase family protein [Thiohalophilus thiocyanatoxydans]|uniref:Agmatine deiminase n=1 Tax=Thiohalophilus thiocyanatoxydans TaxID=381308 RepID=A0A4R8IPT2_9GAMM|nr:agmatine deiminase family protein [Thiohalophilus thiocyanatoxydans]TDY02952.1 agmatine deiminase [Thiohalophilus thiocyanatoxydans]